jgi:hypothetical protein
MKAVEKLRSGKLVTLSNNTPLAIVIIVNS